MSNLPSNINAIKHQQAVSLWSERIVQCKQSGLSVKAWCENNNVPISSYYKWQRDLIAAAAQSHESAEACFSEIHISSIQENPDSKPVATLSTKNAQISFYSDMSPALAKAICEALK